MNIEWAELILAAIGTTMILVGGIHSWLKSRENRMQVVLDEMKHDISSLRKDKVDRQEMKEYVELWTKPITVAIDTLTDETRRTRELMEKIYHAGR